MSCIVAFILPSSLSLLFWTIGALSVAIIAARRWNHLESKAQIE